MGNRRPYSNRNFNRKIRRRKMLHGGIGLLGAAVLIAAIVLLGVVADWIVYAGFTGGPAIMMFGGWLESRPSSRHRRSMYITRRQREARDQKVRAISLTVTIIASVGATVLIGLVLISKPPLIDTEIGLWSFYALTAVATVSVITMLVGYRPARAHSY